MMNFRNKIDYVTKFRSGVYFLLLIFIGAAGCNGIDSPESLSHFPQPPDTVHIYKLANFLSKTEEDSIINLETTLKSGGKRYKGISAVPQNYDDFRRTKLDNVYWRGVSVIEGDFRGAVFRSANCSESNFSNSDFRVADIRWTVFDKSILRNCNFSQAHMFHVKVNDADLSHSDFRGANMFGMEGHRAKLIHCNFSGALMKDSEFLDADFTGSTGIKVKLFRAVLKNSKVDSCDFSYCDFTGAGLEGASFKYSRLRYTNFQGAHLQGTDFTGADLMGCKFVGANFENTVFKDAINIPEEVKELLVNGIASPDKAKE